MVPFVIGHLSRPLIAKWVERNRKLINITDRSSILLVVYVAFSEAVVQGIWGQINVWSLLAVVGCSIVLLAIVLVVNTLVAGRWALIPPMKSPSYSAVRRRAWRMGSRWQTCYFLPPLSVRWCCR